MAKKKSDSAVPESEPKNLIGASTEHMIKAAAMLRSKGGERAESCAYIAGRLDHWIDQLEQMNE